MYEKSTDKEIVENNVDIERHNDDDKKTDCLQLPGTILRVFIPAGAVINLLNFIEISSPGGICLIVRIPLLGGGKGFGNIINAIKQAGGSIEVVE